LGIDTWVQRHFRTKYPVHGREPVVDPLSHSAQPLPGGAFFAIDLSEQKCCVKLHRDNFEAEKIDSATSNIEKS
jgi:hypothetical protein